jgi:hypothetical protein
MCRGGADEAECEQDARVNAVVDRMCAMMASGDVEPVECVVQELVNEFPYFQQYPQNKLQLVGALVGQLIASRVLVNYSLIISCRMVLESLKVRLLKGKRFVGPRTICRDILSSRGQVFSCWTVISS